jgi:hypothetical protein
MRPAATDAYPWSRTKPPWPLTLLEWLHYLAGILAVLIGGLVFVLPAAVGMVARYGQFGVLPTDYLNRLVFGLFGIAYGVGSCYSASRIGRRMRREFSLRWAFTHVLTVIGAPLALLTWLVLTRESIRQAYASIQLPFTPLLVSPSLPVKVIPIEASGPPVV